MQTKELKTKTLRSRSQKHGKRKVFGREKMPRSRKIRQTASILIIAINRQCGSCFELCVEKRPCHTRRGRLKSHAPERLGNNHLTRSSDEGCSDLYMCIYLSFVAGLSTDESARQAQADWCLVRILFICVDSVSCRLLLGQMTSGGCMFCLGGRRMGATQIHASSYI